MTAPQARVQRLWRLARIDRRLARIDRECIGSIIEGYVPGWTAPDTTGFTAIASMLAVGEAVPRVEPDGRRVWVTPISDHAPHAARGQHFEDLAHAFIWLDAEKDALLADDDWREQPLDPIEDPDEHERHDSHQTAAHRRARRIRRTDPN
jgi:hypothetical protein